MKRFHYDITLRTITDKDDIVSRHTGEISARDVALPAEVIDKVVRFAKTEAFNAVTDAKIKRIDQLSGQITALPGPPLNQKVEGIIKSSWNRVQRGRKSGRAA